MDYISFKRFKAKAICGDITIPALSELTESGGLISYNEMPVCMVTSQNAHDYFSRNDDNEGLNRGHLTSRIMRKLAGNDDHHQDRWDRIWDDDLCQKYKRPEHKDFWVWNHDFFNAPVEDLEHIWDLIKSI